jgi:hypothetical protein
MFDYPSDIFKYIQSYYRSVFKPGYFLVIMMMMAIIIYLNYFTRLLVMDGSNWSQKFWTSYFLFLIPFATAYLMQQLFFRHIFNFYDKWFLSLLLLAPAFFSFRVNFNFHHTIFIQYWQGQEKQYWFSAFNYLTRAMVLLIPTVMWWWLMNSNGGSYFGLKKLKKIQPYFILLFMMIPLLLIASNHPVFLQQYPVALHAAGTPYPVKKIYVLLYELFYTLDFFSIEFFFRGFLIIALIRICGLHSIIPAACFYCCIHLGKPMPEAISSFFGGLLLGIISYHTKSIWGGFIIHVGIAWLMELFAYLQLNV